MRGGRAEAQPGLLASEATVGNCDLFPSPLFRHGKRCVLCTPALQAVNAVRRPRASSSTLESRRRRISGCTGVGAGGVGRQRDRARKKGRRYKRKEGWKERKN